MITKLTQRKKKVFEKQNENFGIGSTNNDPFLAFWFITEAKYQEVKSNE